MQKLVILLTLCITILSAGCKKSDTPKDNVKDNTTSQLNEPKTDMEQFKKSLSIFQNPQYDLLYKLIEKGIDAELEEDITIAYPSHAQRLENIAEITIKKGATPLGIAAVFCTPALVNDLLEKGADPKAKVNGMEISAYIIQCGQAEQAGMFENYMKHARTEVEQKQPEIYKNKPYLYAANALIKDNITDADGMGETILNYAVKNNLNESIKTIIKYAGAINYTNEKDAAHNTMPIITAINYKNAEALGFFLSKTGSLLTNITMQDGSKVLLIDYIFYTYPASYIEELIEKADISAEIWMKSLLNSYSKKPGIDTIKMLLEKSYTSTLEEKVMVVIDNKIAVEFRAGSTIAHIAAGLNYTNILKGLSYFNYNGADDSNALFNRIDENGRTPLHVAALLANTEAVKILLESDVMLNILDKDFLLPLETAILELSGKNQTNIVKMLLGSSLITNAAQFYAISNHYQSDDTCFTKRIADNKDMEKIINQYMFMDGQMSYVLYDAAQAVLNNSENKDAVSNAYIKTLQAGVENTAPVLLQSDNVPNLMVKYATPVMLASIMCNEAAVNDLILAKADINKRIAGQNDLKFNALDFAERLSYGNCDSVKNLLKNPASAHISEEKYEEYQSSIPTNITTFSKEGI